MNRDYIPLRFAICVFQKCKNMFVIPSLLISFFEKEYTKFFLSNNFQKICTVPKTTRFLALCQTTFVRKDFIILDFLSEKLQFLKHRVAYEFVVEDTILFRFFLWKSKEIDYYSWQSTLNIIWIVSSIFRIWLQKAGRQLLLWRLEAEWDVSKSGVLQVHEELLHSLLWLSTYLTNLNCGVRTGVRGEGKRQHSRPTLHRQGRKLCWP